MGLQMRGQELNGGPEPRHRVHEFALHIAAQSGSTTETPTLGHVHVQTDIAALPRTAGRHMVKADHLTALIVMGKLIQHGLNLRLHLRLQGLVHETLRGLP